MEKTRIVLDPAYKITEVDPRIFGGFLELIGRAVYLFVMYSSRRDGTEPLLSVSGPVPDACNTYENPNAICSQPLQAVKISEGKASVQLPPLSVTAITFRTT